MHHFALMFAGLCAGITGYTFSSGGEWHPWLIAACGWLVASNALNRLHLIRLVSVVEE